MLLKLNLTNLTLFKTLFKENPITELQIYQCELQVDNLWNCIFSAIGEQIQCYRSARQTLLMRFARFASVGSDPLQRGHSGHLTPNVLLMWLWNTEAMSSLD